MFDEIAFDEHEYVAHIRDAGSGLHAIIAVHSTVLGPAAGGCRLWSYPSPGEALTDVLRLSRGMSYKNALAGLKMGGGKCVILGPVPSDQRKNTFQALGEVIERLSGLYITAEDVGVSPTDMEIIASRTKFVSGIRPKGGIGGDPSPITAQGVRRGIEATAQYAFERKDLDGLRIAVQGLGGVGENLCRELAERGAKLLVSDIDERRIEAVCDQYGADRTDTNDILLADVDVIAPCALGGVITEKVAARMRARAVAGGANNQLHEVRVGNILRKRGISYAPDYVINSGGIIAVAAEYSGDKTIDEMLEAVDRIRDRTMEIYRRSDVEDRSTAEVADEMAREVIAAAMREDEKSGAFSRAAPWNQGN